MRYVLGVVSMLVGVGVAAPAQAQCASATECICEAQAAVLARAHVVSTSGPETTLAIDSTVTGFSRLDGGSPPPASIVVPADDGDVPGREVIVGVDGTQVAGRLNVDADGTVSCRFLAPDTHLPVDAVIAALQSQDCIEALWSAGFREPPCHDTSSGCASGGAGGWGGLLFALALLLGARRRLNRARSA